MCYIIHDDSSQLFKPYFHFLFKVTVTTTSDTKSQILNRGPLKIIGICLQGNLLRAIPKVFGASFRFVTICYRAKALNIMTEECRRLTSEKGDWIKLRHNSPLAQIKFWVSGNSQPQKWWTFFCNVWALSTWLSPGTRKRPSDCGSRNKEETFRLWL